MTVRGVVRQGRIVVVEGPALPEGAEVEVDVRSLKVADADPVLAFHGVWADRTDLGDARELVSRQRDEEWQR